MIGKLWEALGIVNGNLISGTVIFAFCVAHPIPQTMAGVQVDTDSDEFQAWYLAFTSFATSAIFESLHNVNEILNMYFKETYRTNRQKKS